MYISIIVVFALVGFIKGVVISIILIPFHAFSFILSACIVVFACVTGGLCGVYAKMALRKLVLAANDNEPVLEEEHSSVGLHHAPVLNICVSEIHDLQCQFTTHKKNASLVPLLSRLSHELNTSLNAVLGAAQVLSSMPGIDEQLVGIIHHSAKVMANLVSDFLDFSELQQGEMMLRRHVFSLPRMLDGLHRAFEAEAQRQNISLQILRPHDVPLMIVGDSTRLRQILSNLLCNSFQAVRGTHGRITVSVVKAFSNMIEFSVTDNGVGIPLEEQDHLFEPFHFQAGYSDNTRTTPGCGLGLPICNFLVQLMGGEINIKSSPGMGTVVSFAIPYGSQPASDKAGDFRDGTSSIDISPRMSRMPLAPLRISRARSGFYGRMQQQQNPGASPPKSPRAGAARRLSRADPTGRSFRNFSPKFTGPPPAAVDTKVFTELQRSTTVTPYSPGPPPLAPSSSHYYTGGVGGEVTLGSPTRKVTQAAGHHSSTNPPPLTFLLRSSSMGGSPKSPTDRQLSFQCPNVVSSHHHHHSLTGAAATSSGPVNPPTVSISATRPRIQTSHSFNYPGRCNSRSLSNAGPEVGGRQVTTTSSWYATGTGSTVTDNMSTSSNRDLGATTTMTSTVNTSQMFPFPSTASAVEVGEESVVIPGSSGGGGVGSLNQPGKTSTTSTATSSTNAAAVAGEPPAGGGPGTTASPSASRGGGGGGGHMSATSSPNAPISDNLAAIRRCMSTVVHQNLGSESRGSMLSAVAMHSLARIGVGAASGGGGSGGGSNTPSDHSSAPSPRAGASITSMAMRRLLTRPLVFVVVDDNSINRVLLSRMLPLIFQCEVVQCESGAEALQAVEARLADARVALLTDIHMPEMDGLELTRILRKSHDAASLPIIGVTADRTAQMRDDCLGCGMHAVLMKPVLRDHLTDTVTLILSSVWGELPPGDLKTTGPSTGGSATTPGSLASAGGGGGGANTPMSRTTSQAGSPAYHSGIVSGSGGNSSPNFRGTSRMSISSATSPGAGGAPNVVVVASSPSAAVRGRASSIAPPDASNLTTLGSKAFIPPPPKLGSVSQLGAKLASEADRSYAKAPDDSPRTEHLSRGTMSKGNLSTLS